MTQFDRSEFDARLKKTRTAMAERALDGLIVSDPSNMAWLTGYDGWSFYVHQAVVISANRALPLWWGRAMDAQGAKRTVYMEETQIHTALAGNKDVTIDGPVHLTDFTDATSLKRAALEVNGGMSV